MQIIALRPNYKHLVEQASSILFDGFQEIWPPIYSSIDAAQQIVQDALMPDRICRIALSDDDRVLGWIGPDGKGLGKPDIMMAKRLVD